MYFFSGNVVPKPYTIAHTLVTNRSIAIVFSALLRPSIPLSHSHLILHPKAFQWFADGFSASRCALAWWVDKVWSLKFQIVLCSSYHTKTEHSPTRLQDFRKLQCLGRWNEWISSCLAPPFSTNEAKAADELNCVIHPISFILNFVSPFSAGMTSEGGGAIAFPVMTLLLHIDAAISRDFSLMIQSCGKALRSRSEHIQRSFSFVSGK